MCAVDDHLCKDQTGLRKGRGCADHIFALRNTIAQCADWQRGLYVNFINFRKAFDSVHRDLLWRIIQSYGIPSSISDIFKRYYDVYTCIHGNSDIMFEVKTGVRQGCVLSTLLFKLVIDCVLSLQCVNRFTYLGSMITTKGGADEDIKNILNKARNAFGMLFSMWQSA